MSTYLKHVEITKFSATNTNDTSLDSLLKYKCTLKNSTLYLLSFSRNRQNSNCTSKRKIKLIHTNIKIIILVFYMYSCKYIIILQSGIQSNIKIIILVFVYEFM